MKTDKKDKLSKSNTDFKNLVLAEYEKGNIVFMTCEGPATIKLDEFLKQPIEGILYDLNRDEAVILTFIDNPKWVNDFAVCKVIRELYARQNKSLPTNEAEVKHPIDVNGKTNKKVTYCFRCGINVKHQKYCHGCGSKLIWC